ncbi:hypothetical protein PFFVO_06055, partial [Plasmodium falciparum Vietnam Oak-Knoll (FVO)]
NVDANEEEEEVEETEEAPAVNGEGEELPPGPPSPAQNEVNPCEIVKTLFEKPEDFNVEACTQKYGLPQRHWGWKCVTPTTSNDTTREAGKGGGEGGDSSEHGSRHRRSISAAPSSPSGKDTGSVCVPPRRRRLYVGKLEQWANNSGSNTVVSESQPQVDAASTETSQTSLLRDAFIQSAAVETFFLWHKYKVEKKAQALPTVLGSVSDDSDPQEELQQTGEIPNDFLRLMFYTLGDYRDICIGDENVIKTLKSSGDTKIKDISEKIEQILSKLNGTHGQQPSDKRKSWWDANVESIWNGMICALTYKETSGSGGDGKTPTQDPTVKSALLDTDGKKPKETKYQYTNVKLDEHSGGGGAKPTGGDTPLTDFISRPPYFRYLEEWGQNFCKERKKRLEEVRKGCREKASGDPKYCSGDGHDCTDDKRKYNDMLADLYCPDCYEQCRKYRKWIDIKFAEFHNQKNKYGEEHEKLTNGDNSNADYKKLKGYSTAAKFLAALKHCSNDQNSGEKGTEDKKNNKIDFENITQTFSRSTYCKTCPPNKVSCNVIRGTNHCTPVNGNEWQSDFEGISENDENTTKIDVKMIDRRGPFIKEYMNEKSEKSEEPNNSLFKDSYLFKGLRNQKWECRFKEETIDVCKLTNFDGNIDLNKYTTFKVLLHYWLEDFIESYYILKKKKLIEQCTKNKEQTCSEQSKNDCACVITWIEQKEKEWKQIKEHFNNRKEKEGDDDMKSSVKKVLEDLQHLTELDKIMKPCDGLDKFKDSLKCNGSNPSEEEDINKKDIIDCMIKDIQTKIGECTSQPSDKTQTTCDENLTPDVEDDEEDLLLEEENTVEAPKICGEMKEETKEQEEGDCNPASPAEPEKKKEEEPASPAPSADTNPEQTPVLKPKEEAPARDVAPPAAETPGPTTPKKTQPPQPQPQPPQPDLSPLKTAL